MPRPRGRRFFHTLVGAARRAQLLESGPRAAASRTHAREPASGFSAFTPNRGEEGSPGHTVGRRRVEEKRREGRAGGGRLATFSPPASAKVSGRRGSRQRGPPRPRSPACRVGWEEACGVSAARRGWEPRGWCCGRAARPGCWCGAHGAARHERCGGGRGEGGASGGVCSPGRRGWDAVGVADDFRHIEAWVAGVRHPSLPTRTPRRPQPSCSSPSFACSHRTLQARA